MISFEKEPNEVWHSEYKILDNGYYVGNIAKYNKRLLVCVCKLCFYPNKGK